MVAGTTDSEKKPRTVTAIPQVYELGQSFWLDYIRRDLVASGELAELIDAGEVRGMTSNPTIFEEAIAKSDLYTEAIRPLAHADWDAGRIFETLAVEDIRAATDLFLPLYEGTDGKDGFVSIEVNPRLADETPATLEEARRLWQSVNRPNLMVKIPATPSGIPAIEQSIFEGINVNVTLVFSLERYSQVMEAYLRGLERRLEAGEPLDRVASVASFFVSRVDTAVDGRLEAIIREEGASAPKALALLGKAAIANAKLAYAQFKAAFGDARFGRLRAHGGRIQRPLWASTSTKNPDYSDVLYVEELIGSGTVNTLPPKTLEAFRDHGRAELTLDQDLAVAWAQLDALTDLGISMQAVTAELERDGVRKFADSYDSLLKTVGQRAEKMRLELGALTGPLAEALQRLDQDRIGARFWRRDSSLWGDGKRHSQVTERLSWLDRDLKEQVSDVQDLVNQIQAEGVLQVGWIGAPGLLKAVQEVGGDSPALQTQLLNSLDPEAVKGFASRTPVTSTVFVVVGSGLAEQAMMEDSWRRAKEEFGDQAGERFLAIAPSGSSLEATARGRSFRRVYDLKLPPLTEVGLLLVTLAGGTPVDLLRGAQAMRERCAAGVPAARSPGLYLGAFLGAAATNGIQRVGLVADPPFAQFAEWLASELAAKGVGSRLTILPSPPVHLALGDAAVIYLHQDTGANGLVGRWLEKGAPVLVLEIGDGVTGLGAETVRWEMGAAVAAHLLGVQPIPAEPPPSQLDRLVATYRKKRKLNFPKPAWESPAATMWTTGSNLKQSAQSTLADVAESMMRRLKPGQTLLLGLYRGTTDSTEREIQRVTQAAGEGLGVDSIVWFGPSPNRVIRPEKAKALLLSLEPRINAEVPELGVEYGMLLQMQVLADLADLQHLGVEASAVHLMSEEAFSEFVRSLEAAARR